MARMIPNEILYPDERSKEPDLFEHLKAGLSDDYYVFHSLKFYYEEMGRGRDYEADFVILHPQKGFLCVECKCSYGGCSADGKDCYYDVGCHQRMSTNPFEQARDNKYALMHIVQDGIQSDRTKAFGTLKKICASKKSICGFYHAVWFGSMRKQFIAANLHFPMEKDGNFTLFFDDTCDPGTVQDKIERIFQYWNNAVGIQSLLNADTTRAIVECILCPAFHVPILPDAERSETRFAQLLDEQRRVLDFLEDQDTCAIRGLAGSGKTFVAVEKAHRLSMKGEKVLFLCYTLRLVDSLNRSYRDKPGYENITFIAIGEYCKQITGREDGFYAFYKWLDNLSTEPSSTFAYKHVIVDEAQDFSEVERMLNEQRRAAFPNSGHEVSSVSLLEAFSAQVTVYKNGCFYVFYDGNQNIQGIGKLPEFLNEIDCRITLRRNCRNSREIAERLQNLGDIQYKDVARLPSIESRPVMHFVKDRRECLSLLRQLIQQHKGFGLTDSDIVVLTMKSKKKVETGESCLSTLSNPWQVGKVLAETFRKYKGLEAKCAILVDVDKRVIDNEICMADRAGSKEGILRFKKCLYVATSRARSYVHIISTLTQAECFTLLQNRDLGFQGEPSLDKAFSQFAATLGYDLG